MSEFLDRNAPSRRGILQGAGVLGTGLALAACGAGKSAEQPTSSAAPEGQAAAPVEIQAADVPVGGGLVVKDAEIVVTQPTAGEFHAFSALCPHQQCLVSKVADGTIDCPCHGSKFNATTGDVEHGPATSPLAAKTLTVDGATLTVA